MSGFAGIINRAAEPVSQDRAASMVRALAHRGALVKTHSFDTGFLASLRSEALFKTDWRSVGTFNELVIAADTRLDNRPELGASLGLPPDQLACSADDDLILRAYARWGKDCISYLLGDFAFAIWDKREKRVFCARDQIGVRPFVYHVDDHRLLFGSEVKCLFAGCDLDRVPDDAAIGAFLRQDFQDTSSTFFKSVRRLPPAHCLMIESGVFRIWKYWSLDPEREVKLASDQEYAEAFREIFSAAVVNRLRGVSKIGATLSGGLDSSSVVCIARQHLSTVGSQRLTTLSRVFDGFPEIDERRHIDKILTSGGIDSVFIDLTDLQPLERFDELVRQQDQAFFAPGLSSEFVMLGAARERGIPVILSGHGGDETVSFGHYYLKELAMAGQWRKLAANSRHVARVNGISTAGLLLPHVQFAMLQKSSLCRRLYYRHRRLRGQINGWLCEKSKRTDSVLEIINPAIAALADAQTSHRSHGGPHWNSANWGRYSHHDLVKPGQSTNALEVLDRVAASQHIEIRHPFMDQRLIEFCLALPSDQKLNKGWGRGILRNAMQGILPPEIQWRTDKCDFTPHLRQGMLHHHRALMEEVIIRDNVGLDRYVDMQKARELFREFLGSKDDFPAPRLFMLCRLVALGLWLKQAYA